MNLVVATILAIGLSMSCCFSCDAQTSQTTLHRAKLESPGGDLVFGLRLDTSGGLLTASIVNGSEEIGVPETAYDTDKRELTLGFSHYDSSIIAIWDGRSGSSLEGVWKKRTAGGNRWIEMKFSAEPTASTSSVHPQTDPKSSSDVSGRWAVDFDGDDDPSVGVFETAGGVAAGTFLTTTGDYRYLAGTCVDGKLTLSCFDGAHAFLFRAKIDDAGKMAGDFWSSTNWHDTWTAVRDDNAALPDPLGLTTWNETVRLSDLKFPDVDGVMHSLDEEQFAGRAIVLQLFGTWCPNCDDAGSFLAELHKQYSPQGLSVVGLAFELTDDAERNARQVQRYVARHRTKYPVLIAGLSDKAKATESFRALDRIRSYPTTVFLNGRGEVQAIYTGFSGPATGEEHERLKQKFHQIMRETMK